ncbi:SEC12-like protein 2 [Camellia lanceoleosa]|uniref:SEC12-like protein 2 n=1 Tax=Camellia lanceoleosa TaxID=1840588 RepID=A0ACC0IBT3_9ERIC|nr:SEC12-like protein 2 [Camellia lanceoleosa]
MVFPGSHPPQSDLTHPFQHPKEKTTVATVAMYLPATHRHRLITTSFSPAAAAKVAAASPTLSSSPALISPPPLRSASKTAEKNPSHRLTATILATGTIDVVAAEKVSKLRTGADLPYRMAVHPGGDGIICSLPKVAVKNTDVQKLGLKSSDKVLDKLEDIGQQLALTFNNEGSLLALGGELSYFLKLEFHACYKFFLWFIVRARHKLYIRMLTPRSWLGGKALGLGGVLPSRISISLLPPSNWPLQLSNYDGKLRVFKWPSMEIILDEVNVHATVKDLDFSPDGKFLMSVGSSGPGRVWDVTSLTPVASLSKENDEMFGFCRFSRSNDKNPVLYITAMRGQGGSIVKWDTSLWKRVSSKHIIRDPISAFNVSADGKLLAIGTIQGDVLIINSSSMHVQNMVRKAHLGLVTALMISQDSRALVSASLDSSARVTLIKDDKKNGLNLWIIILIILLAMAVYYVKAEGIFP